MQLGALTFPMILEDTTEPTCIRIPLAFVKAILITLGAPYEYKLVVHHYDKGVRRTSTVVIDDPATENHATYDRHEASLKAIDFELGPDSLLFRGMEPLWKIFALAFMLFLRRGARRLSIHHLHTLLYTAIICQVRRVKYRLSDSIKKILAKGL